MASAERRLNSSHPYTMIIKITTRQFDGSPFHPSACLAISITRCSNKQVCGPRVTGRPPRRSAQKYNMTPYTEWCRKGGRGAHSVTSKRSSICCADRMGDFSVALTCTGYGKDREAAFSSSKPLLKTLSSRRVRCPSVAVRALKRSSATYLAGPAACCRSFSFAAGCTRFSH
jgi:hypothetical protein